MKQKSCILVFVTLIVLFLPAIISAKTITCTTTSNYVVGKNPYDEASVICSDGIPEVFAVIEQNTGYISSDEVCKEGKTYALDIILTYDFQDGDNVIIDGIDQGYIFPTSFWHITSKEIIARVETSDSTATYEEPEIELNDDEAMEDTDENKIYYQIEFDVNGGKENIDRVLVLDGEKIAKPKDPTRAGYNFAGWYYNNLEFDFTKSPTSDMKIVAKWDEDPSGKENISFIKLTGLLIPSVGDKLDTSVKIITFTNWNSDIFNVEIGYRRGKNKENISENISNANKHVVEAGYYYMPYITITPGNGYTLANTLITLNHKNVTVMKEENRIIITGEIYGPLVNGVSAEPIIVIPDYSTRIAKNETFENKYVEYYINEHDEEVDDVIVVKGCVTLSNTKDFKTSGCPEVGDGSSNISDSSMMDGFVHNITSISLKNKNPGTYTTDIILTDIKGRKYKATYTITRSNNDSEKVNIANNVMTAEFYGEISKHWVLNTIDLTDQEFGKKLLNNSHINDMGSLILVEDINVVSEDGEKTNGEFTIKILLSDEMRKYKKYNFVYVSEGANGNVLLGEIIKAHLEGEYLVAKLPHLSTYAIIGNDDEIVDNSNSNNSSNINSKLVYICGIGVVILALLFFLVLKHKRRNK